MSSVDQIPNLRRVSEQLVTSGQPNEAQLASIASEGFEAVINLALHNDPRYSLRDEEATVTALGMEYVHIPVQFSQPKRSELLAFYEAMHRLSQRRLWVHCAMNMRVTAFLGLYWANECGWDRAKAFELMDNVWEPNDVWSKFIAENLGNAG